MVVVDVGMPLLGILMAVDFYWAWTAHRLVQSYKSDCDGSVETQERCRVCCPDCDVKFCVNAFVVVDSGDGRAKFA